MEIKVIIPDNFIWIDGTGYWFDDLPDVKFTVTVEKDELVVLKNGKKKVETKSEKIKLSTEDLHAIHSIDGKTHIQDAAGNAYFLDDANIAPFADAYESRVAKIAADQKAYDEDPARITEHLEAYAKEYSKGKLTYNGFSEDFTREQRIEVKQTIDFLERLGEEAPETIVWYGTYGDQIVSLDTLIGWMVEGGKRRLKRFNSVSSIKGKAPKTKEQAEAEFMREMEA